MAKRIATINGIKHQAEIYYSDDLEEYRVELLSLDNGITVGTYYTDFKEDVYRTAIVMLNIADTSNNSQGRV